MSKQYSLTKSFKNDNKIYDNDTFIFCALWRVEMEWANLYAYSTVQDAFPDLATWIFRDWLSPASKSRYGWKIAKSTLILKNNKQTQHFSHTNINKKKKRGVILMGEN